MYFFIIVIMVSCVWMNGGAGLDNKQEFTVKPNILLSNSAKAYAQAQAWA